MASLSFISTIKLTDLLRTADPEGKMQVRVLSSTRLAIGIDPLKPTKVIDFAKETSGPLTNPEQDSLTKDKQINPTETNVIRLSRKRGDYWFELSGERTQANSLKQLLAESLLAMERAKPGFLEKLSHLKGRSKRIVARDRKQLFSSSHLVSEYSEVLTDGWFFGTNNSAAETKKWLGDAAKCVGGKLGDSFRTSLG
jgi:hypothetical protein